MEFYGLIGESLSHSLSEEIHNKVYKTLNLNAAYKLFEIPPSQLDSLFKSIKLLNISGVNVTIPYKEEVIHYLDIISPEAQRIGSVNTIYNRDGNLHAYNTDYYGFGMMLSGIDLQNGDAMVLGYGGAAKTVVTYLLDHGIKNIYLVSRRKDIVERDKSLDKRIYVKNYDEIDSIKGQILVNTTPVGTYPYSHKESPVSEGIVANFNTIADLIYNPKETKLLQFAKRQNKIPRYGLPMLIYQALKAIEIWEDISISDDISVKLLDEYEDRFTL